MWSATEGWRGWRPVVGVWVVASVVTRTASRSVRRRASVERASCGPHGRMTDATAVLRRDARAMAEKLTIVDVEGDVATAVARIEDELHRLGVTVFAKIDHAAGARAAGLELADEVVLVFGDPAVGTALMQADPQVGIDLPLRMLVWAEDGRTRVAYRDPRRLAVDPASAELATVLGKMNGLLERLARVGAVTG